MIRRVKKPKHGNNLLFLIAQFFGLCWTLNFYNILFETYQNKVKVANFPAFAKKATEHSQMLFFP